MFFTCDVEDWYHAENIRRFVDRTSDHTSLSMLDQILDLLAEKDALGTFFVLGEVAREYPSCVRKIADLGHEIASHGMSHALLDKLNYEETAYEVAVSKRILEEITEQEVVGFRSPCFSSNDYLQQCLCESGYRYTSNGIVASFHNRYGAIIDQCSRLPDFSLPVAKFCGLSVPATGGGWFRLFPVGVQKFLLKHSFDTEHIFYCHPWDFDPHQPLAGVSAVNKFRHSVNSGNAIRKLKHFDFYKKTLAQNISTIVRQ